MEATDEWTLLDIIDTGSRFRVRKTGEVLTLVSIRTPYRSNYMYVKTLEDGVRKFPRRTEVALLS